MSVSLTKEEFLKRWSARKQILAIAIMEDIKNVFPLNYESTVRPDTNELTVNVDITKPVAELLRKEIRRVIDLVYLEDLD